MRKPHVVIGTKMMLRGHECARIPRRLHLSCRPPFVIRAKAGIQGRRRTRHQRRANVSIDGPPFSYPGVPAATGMGDCYENAPTRLSSPPFNPSNPRSRHSPEFVIPAKAGIHALTSREGTPTGIPPPTSTQRPHCVFPARARPEPRDKGPESRRGGEGKVRPPPTSA